MIQLEGLRASIRKKEILKGIDLRIEDGEFIALVGPNGAGKTTLLKHLNGLLKPSSGRVLVDGLDTRKTKVSALARRVGFLFQNPDHQIICRSLHDEIRFGLKHTQVPKEEWEERIAAAAARVGLSAELASAVDPLDLSRPRRQRVALASVLAMRPQVLVLDEPTSAQDPREARRVMEIAGELNESGVTVILVSHDMELVSRYARRAVALIEGRLEFDGSPSRLFADSGLLERAGLYPPGLYRLLEGLGSPYSGDSRLDLERATRLALQTLKEKSA
jgi:energy-coupling factor transport system ATP-binding protein